MHVVGVVGPGAADVARELTDRLGERGTVARVSRGEAASDGGSLVATGAPTTRYALDEAGTRIEGPPRSLSAALDDLAPDHDFVVVTGHEGAAIPTVVVGDGTPEPDDVVARLDADDPAIGDAVDAALATEPHVTLEALVARVKDAPGTERSGAIATFTGRVRSRDGPDDPETTMLEFESYEGVAEERMAAIAAELEEREGVHRVLMHHRTGVVEAGEDIVFVVVLAGHRPEAFETVSDGIERLKAEVPLFKREVTLEGEFWAHQRD